MTAPSASLQQGQAVPADDTVRRLPAARLDALISDMLQRWLPGLEDPMSVLAEVRLAEGGLLITLSGDRSVELHGSVADGEEVISTSSRRTVIKLELALPLRGGKRHILLGKRQPRAKDRTLIAALRRGHAMVEKDRGMPLAMEVSRSPYERRVQRLAFLAPDIQRAIIEGTQPASLNLERLVKSELPISWEQQRELLGFEPH